VFKDSCGNSNDHAVLVVGYGVENGDDYYLIKNSYGKSWGEDGYIKIWRNSGVKPDGQCGILKTPSIPSI